MLSPDVILAVGYVAMGMGLVNIVGSVWMKPRRVEVGIWGLGSGLWMVMYAIKPLCGE